MKTRTGAVGLLLAVVPLLSSPAAAGQDEFETLAVIQACGKWVLDIKDFGKEKVRDYNDYVPPALLTSPGRRKPSANFLFNGSANPVFGLAPGAFLMDVVYPNASNQNVTRSAVGSFKQKGKKLKLRLNDPGSAQPGIEPVQATFADLVSFHLLGDRALVVDVPFVDIRESKVRFKGRVNKDLDEIRMKMKARLFYDIRFMNTSEFADRFGGKGVFKARLKTKDCDD
jgi:hypothetical protein